MKVLEILNGYPGEPFIQEHAKAMLANTACQLNWAFTQTRHSGSLPRIVEGLDHCFAIPNFNRMPKWRKTAYRLANPFSTWDTQKKRATLRSIAKSQPDLIHFQFAGTAIQWAWVAEELKIPFTFSLRGSDVQVAPYTIEGCCAQLQTIGFKAAGVHAVCESLKNQFCSLTSVSPEKVQVIRTAISPDWATIERTPESGNLLSVGRLHWTKGFPDLLLAAHQLLQDGIDFKLFILGEGPERPLLEYMIRDLGLQDRVHLEGKKSHDEIRTYFAKAQVFVLSSLQEGFPNALAEAMMAGIPVVTTDCGGIKEVIQHQHNGYLCRSGDVQSIYEGLKSTLITEDYKPSINNGKEIISRLFSEKNHADKFTNFWKIYLP